MCSCYMANTVVQQMELNQKKWCHAGKYSKSCLRVSPQRENLPDSPNQVKPLHLRQEFHLLTSQASQ